MNNSEDNRLIEVVKKCFELEVLLVQMESKELDGLYRQGYERLPEEPDLGEAQVALASEILPGELW